MDAILLSWVTTAYLLASATFLVPFGKVADLYGRKRIFTYGILIFTVASLGCSVSQSAFMLVCFRIVQGIGAAAMYCIGAAILTSVSLPGSLAESSASMWQPSIWIVRRALWRGMAHAASGLAKHFPGQCVSGVRPSSCHCFEVEEGVAGGKG